MQTVSIKLSAMQGLASQACKLMRVLSNPDLLMILCQLSKGELRVGEIEALLQIEQPTLSQQLSVLRQEGLVSTRRDGKSIYYQMQSVVALFVIKILCTPSSLQQPTSHGLQRFKA